MIIIAWDLRVGKWNIILFLVDLIGRAVLELFSGECDFGQEVGINHYQDVYSFEGGLSDAWSSWAGGLPQVSKDEAFCGRHSLFVSKPSSLTVAVRSESNRSTAKNISRSIWQYYKMIVYNTKFNSAVIK